MSVEEARNQLEEAIEEFGHDSYSQFRRTRFVVD